MSPPPSPPLRLHAAYRHAEALAAFPTAGAAHALCDGQWVVLPRAVLCFVELGAAPLGRAAPGRSHLVSGARFCWTAERAYRVAPDGCPFLPFEVRAGQAPARPLHLFARGAQTPADTYLYLGELQPTETYGYAESAPLGEARFPLSPVVPPQVWHALGGPAPAPADLGEALDGLFARLGGPASVHVRMGVLRGFVERWHGPLRPQDGVPEEALREKALPAPLRAWLKAGGRRGEVLSGQGRLLPPEALVADGEGLLPFYEENQGVYAWATRAEGEDPEVLGRDSTAEPWTPEGMTLSGFLLEAALFEAVLGAPYAAYTAQASDALVARALAPLVALPLAPWRWPAHPTRFFAGGGVLAATCPHDPAEGTHDLWLAARTPAALAYLRPWVDAQWERADL
jgi:hypothetical protein